MNAYPRERNPERNNPRSSQHPRCNVLLQRNHDHQQTAGGRGINISGVDFWHAVEFSRNGRFLQILLRTLRALPSFFPLYRLYHAHFPVNPAPAGGGFELNALRRDRYVRAFPHRIKIGPESNSSTHQRTRTQPRRVPLTKKRSATTPGTLSVTWGAKQLRGSPKNTTHL